VLPFSITRPKRKQLTKKDKKTAPVPIQPLIERESWFLPNPLIKKPSSGKSGTKNAT
jgi:hypothetical protein